MLEVLIYEDYEKYLKTEYTSKPFITDLKNIETDITIYGKNTTYHILNSDLTQNIALFIPEEPVGYCVHNMSKYNIVFNDRYQV